MLRQTRCFVYQISHGIHWIRHYNDDNLWGMFHQIGCNFFYDTCINPDKFFASHAWFSWDSGGDDCYLRTGSFAVISCSTGNLGIKTIQRCGLHQIHRFTFGKTFFNIHQNNFGSEVFHGNVLGTTCPYCSCSNYGNFHNVIIFIVD